MSAELLNGQTYVNREWVKNYGAPDTIEWQASATDIWGQLVTAGNTQTPGQQADILVTTFNDIGGITWQYTWNGPKNKSDYGTAVVCDPNGNTYVAGASHYSNDSVFDIVLLKFDWQGNLLWQSNYDGTGGADYPLEMALDNAGNIYITGASEGNGSGLDIITLKFNTSGSLQWNARYDYNTGTDIGGDIIVNASGSRISVTGGSEDTSATWDYTTLLYNGSGQQLNSNRQSSGQANMDKPKDIVKDANKNYYITGMSFNGSDMDIKLIKLDSTLSPQWVQTYHAGNEGSNCLTIDDSNNLYIGGWQDQSPGVRNFLLLKYTPGGTLAWQRTLSPVQGKPMAQITECTTTDGKTISITGLAANGYNSDIVTAQYTTSGELSWIKAWENVSGSIDYPTGIKQVGDDIYVSGRSIDLTGIKWVTIKYSFFEKPVSYVNDTNNIPQYVADELLIEFRDDLIKPSAVETPEKQWGYLSDFIPDSIVGMIKNSLNVDPDFEFLAFKVFRNLTNSDTISVSRLGDTILIPNFWSTLIVKLPQNANIINAIDSLENLYPYILLSEPNSIFTFASNAFDDLYYDWQLSLHSNVNFPQYVNAHIDVEGAWDYEVGRSFINVGVFDAGIFWKHTDFDIISPFIPHPKNLSESKIIAGKHYSINQLFNQSESSYHAGAHPNILHNQNPNINPSLHGTKVAGIIGGIRNNLYNTSTNSYFLIAGIAGGNFSFLPMGSSNRHGVSIKSFDIEDDSNPGYYIQLDDIANALLEGTLPFNNNNVMGDINLGNHSYTSVNPSILLEKQFKFSFRNGITNVVAAGQYATPDNGSTPWPFLPSFLRYPANFNDEFVICVGSTGFDGEYKDDTNGNGGPNTIDSDFDHFISAVTTNMDVAAPGTLLLITTTSNFSNGGYTVGKFNGTSASTAHVTGLATLMLSYLNYPIPHPDNLSPEDVEEIIQLSATDKGQIPGWDIFTGYGLINATKTLQNLDKAKYKVYHLPNNATSSPSISVSQGTTTLINLEESMNGLPAAQGYEGKGYEVTYTYNYTLPPGYGFVNYNRKFWERNSSATGYKPSTFTNPAILPMDYGCEFSTSPTLTSSTLKSKVFEITKDPFGNQLTTPVWIPDHPNNLKMPFTLYLEDPNVNVGVNEISINKENRLNIYPNPFNNTIIVKSKFRFKDQLIDIEIFSLEGKIVSKLEVSSSELFSGLSITLDDASGIYLLYVKTIDNVFNSKIIKL